MICEQAAFSLFPHTCVTEEGEMMITLLIFILLDLLNAWSYCSLRYVNNRRSELYRRRTPSAGKNRLHNALSNADELSSPCCVNVKVIENVEPSESFQEIFLQSQSWGRNPLLIRGAFKNEAHYLSQVQITSTAVKQPHLFQSNPWPTWEDIKKLASNEDAESRWITHIPKDDTSWNLDLGPFDPDDVDEALSTFDQTEPTCDDSLDEIIRSTLIVNDVDRFIPTLSDWINENFSFIPNWRRDDGQVSLAHNGGGIGPHVDEYDVFLIQMAGIRRWELGKRFISVVEELEKDFLIQGLDVRIILNWHDEIGKEFILHPGDILYLPPRLAHCGIARSDGCMTLSVGVRAPSAREMINQIAEYTSSCFTSHPLAKRYDDPLFLEAYRKSREDPNISAISATLSPRAEISRATKDDMKRLVRDALDHILDNESVFDEILGALLTEPKRLRINYPVASNIEEKALDSQLNLILNHGVGRLHPRNSICFAYSEIHNNNLKVFRLFVDGNKWEIESDGSDQQEKEISMLKAITHGIGLSRESFIDAEKDPDGSIPIRIRQILKDLILRGYLQIDS